MKRVKNVKHEKFLMDIGSSFLIGDEIFISKTSILYFKVLKTISKYMDFFYKLNIVLGANINGNEMLYRWMFLILHTLN